MTSGLRGDRRRDLEGEVRASNRVCSVLYEGGEIVISETATEYLVASLVASAGYKPFLVPKLRMPASGVPLFYAKSKRLMEAYVAEMYRSAANRMGVPFGLAHSSPVLVLGLAATASSMLRDIRSLVGWITDPTAAAQQVRDALTHWYALTPEWHGWIAEVELGFDNSGIVSCRLISDEGFLFDISPGTEGTFEIIGDPEFGGAR